MRPPLLCLTLAVLCASACGGGTGDANAATRYIEQAAATSLAAVPGAEESASLRETGRNVFRGSGCEMCHSITRQRNGMAGPPLGGISERMLERYSNDALEGRRWLFKHIRDPRRFEGPFANSPDYRGAFMPPNGQIKDEELRALVEFLWHLP